MTLAEIRALTNGELRVEIARALGWRSVSFFAYSGALCGVPPGKLDSPSDMRRVPNWPASLNACAELRAVVGRLERERNYLNALNLITMTKNYVWPMVNATARQHAEAALMALQGESNDGKRM